MKTKNKILASIIVLLGTSSLARAQGANPAAQQCAQSSKITLPADGSWSSLTPEQKETMRQCLHAAHKAARAECKTSVVRTDDESEQQYHQAFGQCMSEKGFRKHHHNKEGASTSASGGDAAKI